jgi:hypothetical protein
MENRKNKNELKLERGEKVAMCFFGLMLLLSTILSLLVQLDKAYM